jgi:hypothetical protein
MKRSASTMDILRALDDPNLFGGALRDPATWAPWRAFLAALFGLPMIASDLALYRECTRRMTPPAAAFTEAWVICGRRAGKSFVLAMVAVFLACFKDWRPYLGRGERATIMVIATDRKQARVIFRYVRGLLSIPILAKLVERGTSEIIDLSNGISIEIAVASHRTTRGYTFAAVLADEIAFWPTDDSAEPDFAILDAVRPGLGTLPGAMLLCASSPYAQSGALFDAFRRYHGRDDAPVLVWRAPTRTMNVTFPQATIDTAMERDAASASAEFLAEFRTDVQAFVERAAVEACVSSRVFERPRVPGAHYVGFVDPSGGMRDSMTLAIAHLGNDGVVVLDCLRSRKPPFSPADVVAEFAAVLASYNITTVQGDRYAGAWPIERFREYGITYEPAAKPKSEIYSALLPAVNSRRVDLLDDARLINELCGLERRTARGGRDSIDHRPAGHDDSINAAAGAIVALSNAAPPIDWTAVADELIAGSAEYATMRRLHHRSSIGDRRARRGLAC